MSEYARAVGNIENDIVSRQENLTSALVVPVRFEESLLFETTAAEPIPAYRPRC